MTFIKLSVGDEEEYQDLAASLTLVKELITSIDQEVFNYEKNMRLQEIYQKVDSKSAATVQGDYCFGKEELLRRKLVHEGSLLWKTAAGRFKGMRERMGCCKPGGQLGHVLVLAVNQDGTKSVQLLRNCGTKCIRLKFVVSRRPMGFRLDNAC